MGTSKGTCENYRQQNLSVILKCGPRTLGNKFCILTVLLRENGPPVTSLSSEWDNPPPYWSQSENTIGLENNLWVKIKLSPNKLGMQKANSENIKWMFSQLVYMPTAPLFNKQCQRDITVDCVLPKDRAQVARSTGKPWRDISGDPGTNNRAQAQAALHFWSQGFYKHVRPGSIAFSMRILSNSPLQTPRVLSWALFSL